MKEELRMSVSKAAAAQEIIKISARDLLNNPQHNLPREVRDFLENSAVYASSTRLVLINVFNGGVK